MRFILFILFFINTYCFATSSVNLIPTWDKMIDRCDAIALIEYTSNGNYRAKAKIISILKGKIEGDEIWIDGFSDPWGAVKPAFEGNQFIVFLWKDRRIEYSDSTLAKRDELFSIPPNYELYKAIRAGKAYQINSYNCSYKVLNNQVKYDLKTTDNEGLQPFHSLMEFENFIRSYLSDDKRKFHKQTIEIIKNLENYKEAETYLMMLFFTKYVKYNSIFEKIVNSTYDEPKIALSKLLGKINTEKSKELLIQLLNSDNQYVQGEAVRQLSGEPSEFIGPIFLKYLNTKTVITDSIFNIRRGPDNIMKGGTFELIKSFRTVHYKPAIKTLSRFLVTDNHRLYLTTLGAIGRLDSMALVPHINYNLDNNITTHFDLMLSYIIFYKLEKCIPSLMTFISNIDKTKKTYFENSISTDGLAFFDSDTVKFFLYSDFINTVQLKDSSNYTNIGNWAESYIHSFKKLKMVQPKKEVYDLMYEYYGFNNQFKLNPNLFEKKKHLEDSLVNMTYEIVAPLISKSDISVRVFMDDLLKVNDYIIQCFYKTDYAALRNRQFKKIKNNREQRIILKDKFKEKYKIKESRFKWNRRNPSTSLVSDYVPKFGDGISYYFLEYISSLPDELDIAFLKNLKKYNYPFSQYGKKNLDKLINQAKLNLFEAK